MSSSKSWAWIVLAVVLACPATAFAAMLPPWVSQIQATSSDQRTGPADVGAHAEILLDETDLRVEASGHVERTRRLAIRILRETGRHDAIASVEYMSGETRIRGLKAWILDPDGSATPFGESEFLDLAADRDAYSGIRRRVLDGSSHVRPGSIFCFESKVQDREAFAHFTIAFQNEFPTRESRFRLWPPKNWESREGFNNGAPTALVRGDGSYEWIIRGLPGIGTEPFAPSPAAAGVRIGIAVQPRRRGTNSEFPTFGAWADAARWLKRLTDPSSAATQEVAAKARSIAEGAKGERERIQAVGKFIQRLQYVPIQWKLGRGEGMRPRPAAEVLRTGYGDCKDKAGLMKAMLEALGQRAYLVAISADDPLSVRAEWPDPGQFNHCIVAVASSSDSGGATVSVPGLGPLLLFDPTDPYCPVGVLPGDERGARALLVADVEQPLLQTPRDSSVYHRVERSASMELALDGAMHGEIRETSWASAAARERALHRNATPTRYREVIEGWLGSDSPELSVEGVAPIDTFSDGRFELTARFRTTASGQVGSGRLVAFSPVFPRNSGQVGLPDRRRELPIVLKRRLAHDRIERILPKGYVCKAVPKPVRLEEPFGIYRLEIKATDGRLSVERLFEITEGLLPPAAYPAVRKFFTAVQSANGISVVLEPGS
ncbi:MAG: DUF3857 domain-containing protein [Candidatus Eisenbacteria bacterium]